MKRSGVAGPLLRMFFQELLQVCRRNTETGLGHVRGPQIPLWDSFDNWATWSVPNPINTQEVQAKHGTVIPFP